MSTLPHCASCVVTCVTRIWPTQPSESVEKKHATCHPDVDVIMQIVPPHHHLIPIKFFHVLSRVWR